MLKRPLLAETAENITDIQLPVIGTPKLDGYRCLKVNGEVVSRNFKSIRNTYTRDELAKIIPDGFDGELMLRRKDATFNEISSAFSAYNGKPDFVFHAFDYVKDDLKKPYSERLQDLADWLAANPTDRVVVVPHVLINTLDELEAFEKKCLGEGYEGSMYRKPSGPYKCGRSTLREQILLKKKPWHDSEALIIGFTEQERNENEQETNELGLTKRSTKKEGKVKANTLGNFLAIDPQFPGEVIEIGTGRGLTKELRQEIWDNQGKYLRKVARYTYQFEGTKDKPRFPSWQGFRDLSDLDPTHPIHSLLGKEEVSLSEEERQEVINSFFD